MGIPSVFVYNAMIRRYSLCSSRTEARFHIIQELLGKFHAALANCEGGELYGSLRRELNEERTLERGANPVDSVYKLYLNRTIEASAIPAIEVSCRTMFDQVNATFHKGMVEHTAAAHRQFESSPSQLVIALRDTINSASSMTQTLTGELADEQRKLLALAVAKTNSNAVNPLVKQLSNGPFDGLHDMYMSNSRTFFIHVDQNNELSLDNIIVASSAGASTTAATNQLLVISENQINGWEHLNEIAIGAGNGNAYLHEECEQRIIHYDIKPGNILLDMNFSPKVADFGLAKLCNRDSSHMIMTGCKGTLGYAALELWMPYPVTHKCDVYSFEIFLFEIIGRRRHHDDSLNQSQEWLPRWVWEKFERRELDEMELYGIEEKNRENVNGCFVLCSVLTRGKTSNLNYCEDVGRRT
ncbi:hypothetical protein GIB67_015688 [Kingdonia uniflora]|uniref:Protein kinase domain-containing protein n=1 Tax=Kingdonia uniflora TaxID=39325 RepID=A0A7J7NU69_9MAGN|nr:hypothetical protein GIB67_015688 [Kingdonia uniflora]